MALTKSKWTCNGEKIAMQNGFIENQLLNWKDHFDPEQRMTKRLDAQFKLNFHQITEFPFLVKSDNSINKVLKDWLEISHSSTDKEEAMITKWAEEETEGNFIWIEIELPYRVQLTDVDRHLTFALNHFIVVNRSYQIKDDNDTYFSQSLGMEVIEIRPEEGLFHSIKKVTNQIENLPIPSVSLEDLVKDGSSTAYSLSLIHI